MNCRHELQAAVAAKEDAQRSLERFTAQISSLKQEMALKDRQLKDLRRELEARPASNTDDVSDDYSDVLEVSALCSARGALCCVYIALEASCMLEGHCVV